MQYLDHRSEAILDEPMTNFLDNMNDDASYVCDSCGEEIVIPIDPTQGSSQQYYEDCPVCCNPNHISIEIFDDGEVRAWCDHRD